MRTLNFTPAFIILLLSIVVSDAYAKDYIVEMIFFADKQGSSNSNYVSNQIIFPNLSGSIRLDDSAHAHGFVPLPADTFALQSEAAALSKNGRYKVLKHIAWLQPGLAKEDAIPVRIHAGNNYRNEFKQRTFDLSDFNQKNRNQPVNELDGTIKIVLGRFLHVYTDLTYRKLFKLGAGSSANTLGRDRVLADYAVKTHRKMRSKTLHYIDHPYLGILVEIRPVDS